MKKLDDLLDDIARSINHDLHEGYIVPGVKTPLKQLGDTLANLKACIQPHLTAENIMKHCEPSLN